MTSRAHPLAVTAEPHQALLEEARALLRTAAMLDAFATQHGIRLPPSSLAKDDFLPTTLPFGDRTSGPYAECRLCAALLSLEGLKHRITIGRVTLVGDEPRGTWLHYGTTPICPRHARALDSGARHLEPLPRCPEPRP